MEKAKLQWHPGFSAALRITLHDEMKFLEMHEEYQLSKKPMQIDILIIKKKCDRKIQKAVGRIFRRHNIIEYKSPGDRLSINDFYKVYGYTCFYQSNTDKINQIDPEDMTITFVCSHYPEKMMRHLKEVRKMQAERYVEGIYYLTGDPIPMQILIVPELSPKENYWIHNLRTDLKAGEEIRHLMERYERNKSLKDYEAVMDLITRANWEQMEEEKKMCDALKELFADELKEADARGRAEGMQHGIERGKIEGIRLAKQILSLHEQGNTEEQIAEICGLSAEQVREILE